MSDSCCKDCGVDIVRRLNLSRRRGHDGQPMTKAEAIHLFVDSRGGRCTDCCLKHQAAEVRELVRKAPVSPMFEELDLLRLRQRMLKTFGIHAGSRESAVRVNAMNREELLAQLQPA